MCLKKKKDTKKKEENSVRSASRLDDKEKKLVSKEMHAVYNEHMERKKFEFKPANLEEINILVRDINDNEFVRKKSIIKQNHIEDKVSVASKKTSSKKSSRCNSIASSKVSRKSRQNSIIEDFVLSSSSIKSNIEEKRVSEFSHNHSEICETEIQEKQIDLSSECSMESNENKEIGITNILQSAENKEIGITNILHSTENKENDITNILHVTENEEIGITNILHATENKEIDIANVLHKTENNVKKEVESIKNEIIHEEIIENQSVKSGILLGKVDVCNTEILQLSRELEEKSLDNHSEHVVYNTETIEEENTYLGYHIPDNEYVYHNDNSLKNVHDKHVNKSIDNLVENIKDTMNTVKTLIGEEKLDYSEDENNNYKLENCENVTIKSKNYEKKEIITESITVKKEIINSIEENEEKTHKENVITTTFYEEVLPVKEEKLNFSCVDYDTICNSTNHFENIENSLISNVESIKKFNSTSEINYQNEKIKNIHSISNNSLDKHNEALNKKTLVNHSRTSSIHSKNDKVNNLIKNRSLNCSSMSNISTISSGSVRKSPSVITQQSKSRNYSPIQKTSNEIVNNNELKMFSPSSTKVIHNDTDIALIYKPKRKASSIKSIDTSLSYGLPTKRHVINRENYNEIKKITEFQLDNKMDFTGKYNGYYLIKPQSNNSVCKYTGGKKIIIGGNQNKSVNDKKIILFGTKGSGKTTLINNYCNILYGVGRECNFRFIINSPDEIEPTKNIVTYEFNNTILGYKFTIIDTPGFDSSVPTNETFSYKTLYENYLKNYISKANRILIHGVSIVIRNEDDIWNSKFYRQISGIRRIFCGNYENKNLYPIVTNAKAFSKLNYFDENLHGVYDQNDMINHFKNENKIRKHTKRRANWYKDVFRMTSNIYEKNFEGKRTLDKIYLFNETEAACDQLFNALQYNLPILLKKKQGKFETIHEC